MLNSLRQFPAFQLLDQSSLEAIAPHARLVDLPPGRWLLRPGRQLAGHYYLLAGRIRTWDPDRVVRQSRQAVYPGCGAIRTLSAVRLLQVDATGVALVGEQSGAVPVKPETLSARLPSFEAAEDTWQVRFLRSHMLSALTPVCWQQLLASLGARDCEPGEQVISSGERGSCCYIVASGCGRVHRDGQTLRTLGPGDFFGEDALLAQAPRNATVTMISAGRVMQLEEAVFRRWLVDALMDDREPEASGHSNARIERIHVTSRVGVREKLAALDPCARYLVRGPAALRTLSVFLLRQRGVRARAEAEPSRNPASAVPG